MSIFFYLFASHFVCFARIVWWRLILLCQHFLQLSTNLYDLCKWERNETKVTLSTIILFSQWKLVGYKTKGNSLCTVKFIHHNTTNLFMWGKKEREKKTKQTCELCICISKRSLRIFYWFKSTLPLLDFLKGRDFYFRQCKQQVINELLLNHFQLHWMQTSKVSLTTRKATIVTIFICWSELFILISSKKNREVDSEILINCNAKCQKKYSNDMSKNNMFSRKDIVSKKKYSK